MAYQREGFLLVLILATTICLSSATLNKDSKASSSHEDNKIHPGESEHHEEQQQTEIESPEEYQEETRSKGVLRGLINGRYSTFVRPPADFKPIVYENKEIEKSEQEDKQQEGASAQEELELPWIDINQHHQDHSDNQILPGDDIEGSNADVDPSLENRNHHDRWANWHDVDFDLDMS